MVANKTHASFSSSLNNGFQLGSNAGTLEYQQNHHYHYPPEPPEIPPSPSLFIPFNRDPDFIDCKTILKQLDRRCAEPGSRTALVGLSGVGKSQLAIEYAYRVHRRSSETWIFWVHASNAYQFEQGYWDITDSVKLSGRRDPKANIFKLVHDWLRASKNGEWILILDNVDNASFFINYSDDIQGQAALDNGRTDRPLLVYISPNGSLLITSQSKEVALELVKQCNLIALATMLEYMPLAIVQAAAYISDPDRNCSVQQYINEFHESNYLKIRLLEEDEEQIRQSQQSAADLLSLMSFFDRQGIPKALLQHQNIQDNLKPSKDNKSDTTESSSNLTDELNKDILKLQRYSLISVNIDQESFNMHSLVQLVTRRWLEVNGKLEKWKQQYIQNLYITFPIASYENWAQCQLLFPHARSAADQRPHERNSLMDMENLASIYRDQGRWKKAEQLQGRWKKAKQLQVQVLKLRKQVLGTEHSNTLSSIEDLAMHNLVSIYQDQGRWKKAEQLQVQVLELYKQVLGTEHHNTLSSMVNLTSTYQDQGQWKKVE
ncbi:hypothetical protein M752DRAFT_321222 [Aspergillus phoenicis ATCC 13157]|uniref:Kinesin n=1 Tax=Aspergillus phoenicis ATCC 13157 TaxID=1353007 RepID=A0A370P989_ASPPH|nr:hypothetical protein M752DRAFT_321222 [Aspergillus phoenicis ATCC 13157]